MREGLGLLRARAGPPLKSRKLWERQLFKATLIDIAALSELKSQYLKGTTAPLDGMWLFGFLPMAKQIAFIDEGEILGYCCVNAEGYLLQLFVKPELIQRSGVIFRALITGGFPGLEPIKGVYVSTAEPQMLSLCVDVFSAFEVQALMYQLAPEGARPTGDVDVTLEPLEPSQLEEAIAFCLENIGAPEEWLRGYLGNLISRRELNGLWRDGRLVATGECRGHDDAQTQYADLGMIVAKGERGKGIATQVLRRLVEISQAKGLAPICSTDMANIASQKAITRAGFFSYNRILRFDVDPPA